MPELATLAEQGNRIAPLDPQASRAYFDSEFRKYASVIKTANLEPQ